MQNSSAVDALLLRGPSTDQGTFGTFATRDFTCGMLELPNRDNIRQYSRIPAGVYRCVWAKSPKFGYVYHVTGVKGRGNILIHPGNFAGDAQLGFKTHSHGCLLPHTRRGFIGGQAAGLMSAPAVSRIVNYFNKRPFTLEVKDA